MNASRNTPEERPRIAITMGDPAGVGPELAVRMLGVDRPTEAARLVVFGEAGVLDRAARSADLAFLARVIGLNDWRADASALAGDGVVDVGSLDAASVVPGQVSAATGAASFRAIEVAIEAALAGRVDAVVTGPIHKEALQAAGHDYPGHTEIFGERTGTTRWCMTLTSEVITCSLVTTHVGLRDVPGLITPERVLEVIELTHEAMSRLRDHRPRLAVCGLNPHAGEHGLFGAGEEERLIAPAIDRARAKGLEVEGPLPPDTAFVPRIRERIDAYICMYHDQGLIPFKMLAFDTGVNLTLGLPIIRTSVDHGTALDLAWQGRADSRSMRAAVRLACRLARGRTSQ